MAKHLAKRLEADRRAKELSRRHPKARDSGCFIMSRYCCITDEEKNLLAPFRTILALFATGRLPVNSLQLDVKKEPSSPTTTT